MSRFNRHLVSCMARGATLQLMLLAQSTEGSGAALQRVNPESFGPKDLPGPRLGQRQSYLRTFKFLSKPAPRTIHVPRYYHDVVMELYDRREACQALIRSTRRKRARHPAGDATSIPAVAALLSDFGFYEPCQVLQRLLPAEITGLQRNDVRQTFLHDVDLGSD
jgi:hypothetical protein